MRVLSSLFGFFVKHKRLLFIYSVAFIIRLAFAIPFIHDWDGFVFSESAKNFLKGETPYMTVLRNDPSIYPDSNKPMTQQWYAYPPLPLLMFTAPMAVAALLKISLTPMIQTLLLKSPFIVGDLIAAWLVYKFLETKSLKLAKRAELLVLFNPLLIWLSSAWGMFDIWMANFILLFFLAFRKSQVWRAGAFLALAFTTKLFPVFFLPVTAIYILRNTASSKQKLKLSLGLAIVLSIITIPFFITSPRGFLNQNLLMHIQRSTQGLSIPALFDYYKDFYPLSEIPLTQISGILMLLSILVVFLLALVRVKTEKSLLWAMVATYLPILLFNKVTNEQYFALMIVLLVALLSIPTDFIFPRRIFYFIKIAVTYGVLIAAALLGFHFLGFLLPDITYKQLGSSTNMLIFYLSKYFHLQLYTYPDSPWTYYNFPATISSFAILPFILLGLLVVFGNWREAWVLRKKIGSEILSISKHTFLVFRNTKLAFVLSVSFGLIVGAVLLLTPAVKTYIVQNKLLTPISLIEEKDLQSLPENPRVGTFYNLWWNNFSHDKDFPYGDWRKTTLIPFGGYYTSKNSFYVQHIKQMKEAKIDFVLVSYHLYDRRRYLTFGYYAEQLGIYYAPMIETGDILGFDEYRPTGPDGQKMLGFTPSKESKLALKNIIISSLADSKNSQSFLKFKGKPAVFIYDGHWFYPSWDEESKRTLASRIVNQYAPDNPDVFSFLSERWKENINSVDDIVSVYPKSIEEFNENIPRLKDFRQAFLQEYREFWLSIRGEVENEMGEIWLASTYTRPDPYPNRHFVIQTNDILETDVFDGEWFYSLANTWVAWKHITEPETIKEVWESQVKLQTERNKNLKKPLFLTTTGAYSDKLARPLFWFEISKEIDGTNTYDWAWKTALQYNPDYVLITSWNEFFEGTAIEPSKEYGYYYLNKTAEWVKRWEQTF